MSLTIARRLLASRIELTRTSAPRDGLNAADAPVSGPGGSEAAQRASYAISHRASGSACRQHRAKVRANSIGPALNRKGALTALRGSRAPSTTSDRAAQR
jgi:hypothetical protein